MKFPTNSRHMSAMLFASILLISAQAMSRHSWRKDNTIELGTRSADFYQKGEKYLDKNYESKDWKVLIAKDMTPYHRLTEADFRVDDQFESKSKVFTMSFIHYQYRCRFVAIDSRSVKAILTEFKVRSGLDRTQSWRRSWFKDPSLYMEHEQGHADINEIAARTFAAKVAEEKPEGVGQSTEEANRDLDEKLAALYTLVADQNRRGQIAYDNLTDTGLDHQAQIKTTETLATRLKQADVKPTWSTPARKSVHSSTSTSEVVF